ncbi:FtsK/SpoIIIE family DNA translocase [Candidatus Soleaferrea massiliensis]|uniref:FtsK/SpoIIIE family DNA translocase n=1 Tax=Candidatus Soleaferrea massiliensis TaxID=1470354 RepID=UPI0009E2F8B1
MRRQISSIVLFAVGILFFFLTLIAGQSVWNFFHQMVLGTFGICSYIIAPILIYVAVLLAMEKEVGSAGPRLWLAFATLLALCGLIQLFFNGQLQGNGFLEQISNLYRAGVSLRGGGVASLITGISFHALFGKAGAIIVNILLLFVLIMVLTGRTLIQFLRAAMKPVKKVEQKVAPHFVKEKKKKFNIDVEIDENGDAYPVHPVQSDKGSVEDILEAAKKEHEEHMGRFRRKQKGDEDAAFTTPTPTPPIDELVSKAVKQSEEVKQETARAVQREETKPPENVQSVYNKPPISILKEAKPVNEQGTSEELKASASRLVDTLKSFGVETRIVNISKGPAVTRYELQPSVGVKISKITNLSDDIALNLAAAGVRIEAPIPNKSAVGIEVPNKHVSMVRISEVIGSREFLQARSKLSVALGRDIGGSVCVADIAKMPHVLIAGATGSGKSVCINSIILSLLYKSSPDEVRFLMIDPKVVELGVYNGIPHLLVPVVTDPRKAAGSLNWAVNEMLNRYKLFAENGVRDLNGYNKLSQREDLPINPLPQIVIIIDELSDLMMAAPNEVEDAICRLAQMARAAGMHLVIATQRPSVDVITGVIKANIPSRIAFAVSSQVDSRTILDSSGAEKLLGRGDMLFFPVGYSKPVRIQGCFVTDGEVEKVVDYIKNGEQALYDEQIMEEIEKRAVQPKEKRGSANSAPASSESDDLLPKAIECAVELGQISTSMLQRKMRVGYARAASLVDEMESRGIIGPLDGNRPREVLINRQQFLEMGFTSGDSLS